MFSVNFMNLLRIFYLKNTISGYFCTWNSPGIWLYKSRNWWYIEAVGERCSANKVFKIHRKSQTVFFNKVLGLRPATLFKKKLWHRCFPVNFAKFLRAPFLQNTSGRLFHFNNKCMMALTRIANTEIFTFIAVLVFKFLSRKVLFINWKGNRNCQKVGYFLRKKEISRENYSKLINGWNVKFSGYLWKR